MRLIIEKDGGDVFAYLESETRFKVNERERKGPRLDRNLLDWECNLDSMPEGHIVIPVKKKPRN